MKTFCCIVVAILLLFCYYFGWYVARGIGWINWFTEYPYYHNKPRILRFMANVFWPISFLVMELMSRHTLKLKENRAWWGPIEPL